MVRRSSSAEKATSRLVIKFVHSSVRSPIIYWLLFIYTQPGTEAGDVVIILQQKPHEVFKRQGDDLYFMHTITLTEALCGFCYVLKV